MNIYQKIMLVAGAFWLIWSLEILYRKQNWNYEESNVGERIAWAVFTGVMTVVCFIWSFLGYFK